jgi:hypothetical protein
MPRVASLLATSAALVTIAASRLAAQQPVTAPPAPSDSSLAHAQVVTSAAADSALRDLGKAMAALAVSVQQIVQQTANKPEVRLAAVQLAGKAVSVAQQTLSDNAGQIEKLLAEAGKRIAAEEASQKAKVPAKP